MLRSQTPTYTDDLLPPSRSSLLTHTHPLLSPFILLHSLRWFLRLLHCLLCVWLIRLVMQGPPLRSPPGVGVVDVPTLSSASSTSVSASETKNATKKTRAASTRKLKADSEGKTKGTGGPRGPPPFLRVYSQNVCCLPPLARERYLQSIPAVGLAAITAGTVLVSLLLRQVPHLIPTQYLLPTLLVLLTAATAATRGGAIVVAVTYSALLVIGAHQWCLRALYGERGRLPQHGGRGYHDYKDERLAELARRLVSPGPSRDAQSQTTPQTTASVTRTSNSTSSKRTYTTAGEAGDIAPLYDVVLLQVRAPVNE